MKRLDKFIREHILNEDIDDNIFWKIDTYFQNNDTELKAFNGLVDICRTNKGYNSKTIDAYVSGNESLFKNQKKFVDFIEDNVQQDTSLSKDYSSSLYNIVKTVIGNKTEGIKYTNIN
jgi:hypothetical protein